MGRRSVEAGIVFVTQVATLALTFVTAAATARIFPTEVRGEYGMFVTLASFVTVFTVFGVPEAIVYFHRQGEADRSRVATSAALSFVVAAVVSALAACVLVEPLADRYFPSGRAIAGLAFAVGVAAVGLRNAIAFLQARHEFLRAGLCGMLVPLLFTIGLAGVWYARAGLVAPAWLYLAVSVVAAAAAFGPLTLAIAPSSMDVRFVRRLLQFSVKSYSQVVVNQLSYRLDIFIVAYLMSDLAAVAHYHVALSLASLLWVIPDSYGQAIYPRLASYRDDRARCAETVAGLRIVLIATFLGACGVALVARWLVPLVFGAEYANAALLVVLLLPGTLAVSVSKILMRYFVSRNLHQVNSLCMLGALAIDVAANFALIPRFGLPAAPVAASLGYCAGAIALAGAFAVVGGVSSSDLRAFPSREVRAFIGAAQGLLRGVSRLGPRG
jgi:O-antigen/teichoic acid export membrane protein